ncbi:hypothetical protein [Lysobacter gummosus]|uniref:hypothetical protein n=1 Tax=Lysobacter gummosus TaxID=262324 RepID=UPI0036370E83
MASRDLSRLGRYFCILWPKRRSNCVIRALSKRACSHHYGPQTHGSWAQAS